VTEVGGSPREGYAEEYGLGYADGEYPVSDLPV